MSTTVRRSVLLPYSPEQMSEMVDRVEDYPGFLPWCEAVSVDRPTPDTAIATIMIAYGGLHQAFTTSNAREGTSAITLRLVEGPFSKLEGLWRFITLGSAGCRTELTLDYVMSSSLLGGLLAPVFCRISTTLVDAFVKEAERRYGGAKSANLRCLGRREGAG